MAAFLISSRSSIRFERSDLADGFSESWLQDLLFCEPDVLPLSDVDPSAGSFIPVCRELSLPKVGGSVYVDLFGVTPAGRPVLIECKFWRNPQARREVIAQILEYSALLRGQSYADLTARLKAKLGWTGANPLFAHAVSHGCSLPEAAFTDSVARNLRNGDFHLIVAGDGIREDAAAIAEHIGDKGTRRRAASDRPHGRTLRHRLRAACPQKWRSHKARTTGVGGVHPRSDATLGCAMAANILTPPASPSSPA